MACRKKLWTEEEQQLLFELHQQYGNKWSMIATKMAGKDDGNIKNKFYSTLRKGLRKINKFITNIKKRSDPFKFKALKTIEELFLTKMIAVVDEKYDEKYEVKPKAIELASCIQKRIVQIAFDPEQYMKLQSRSYLKEEELLKDIMEFNKNCKKRKGKKKQVKGKNQSADQISSEDDSQQHLNTEIKQQPVHTIRTTHVIPKNEVVTEVYENKKTIPSPELPQEPLIKVFKVQQLPMFSSSFVPVTTKNQLHDAKQKKNFGAPSFFAGKAQDFFRTIQQNPLTQSNNLSMSGSWNYDINNSCDVAKRNSGFFIHPSPLGGQTPANFGAINLIKYKQVGDCCMFEDKNQVSTDLLFSSGKIPIMEDNYISMVEHVPNYNQDKSKFLVKSSDLLKSAQLIGKSSTETLDTALPSPYIENSDRINQFLAQVARPNCLSSNADMLIKDYSFGVDMDLFNSVKQANNQENRRQQKESSQYS